MSSALGLQSLPDVFTFAEINEDECMYDPEPTQVKMEDRSSCMQSDGSSYLDLTNHKYPTIKTEYPEDDKGLLSWTQKHPEHWTKKEVLDWIYFVAETVQDIDLTRLRGEAFQDVNGQQLCSMSTEAFITRDPEFGQIFYDMFKSLSRDSAFIEPVQFQENGCSNDSFPKFSDNDNMEYTDLTETTKLLDSVMVGDKELRVCVDSHWYDIDIDEVTTCLGLQQPRLSEDDDCWTSESETGSVANYDMSRLNSTGSDVFSSDEDSNPDLNNKRNKKSPSKRQRDSSASDDGNRQKSNRASKGNHLWEFIRDLLKDSKFNPHLLRWEDKDSGVFRFVQSEAVAQMWGRKKNNPGMTYEKLSRAMRFCRTAGYFGDVPKNGKFPKKLCFRFGPKAFGWKEI